jgi:hypothetical protein
MTWRRCAFLLVTLAVLAAAWWLSERREPATEISSQRLHPGLLDRVNEVTSLSVKSRAKSAQVDLVEGKWRIRELSGYPAEPGKVKQALVQLGELRVVENKTRDPALYARLGVEDLETGDAESTLVTLKGGDATIASLLLGERRTGSGAKPVSQRYVRRAGEPQAVLVDGELDIEADPLSFAETEIANLASTRIRRIRIRHGDGEELTVARAGDDRSDFELNGLPEGMTLNSSTELSSMAGVLANLRFESVKPAEAVRDLKPELMVELETNDGLTARLEEFKLDDTAYARFAFSAGAPAAAAPEQPTAAAREETADDGADQPAAAEGQDTATAEQQEQKKADDAKAEAERLSARASGWVYELPEYKMTALRKRQADLIKPIENEDEPETE